MDLVEAATEILEPLGYEILEVTVAEGGRKSRVLLRIDRLDEQAVSIEDVATASEVFGLELDRLDPFDHPYRLEVESPGAKRPLTRSRHFQRFHDLYAKVRLVGEAFRGRIRQADATSVTFDIDGVSRKVAITDIVSARLDEWPDQPR